MCVNPHQPSRNLLLVCTYWAILVWSVIQANSRFYIIKNLPLYLFNFLGRINLGTKSQVMVLNPKNQFFFSYIVLLLLIVLGFILDLSFPFLLVRTVAAELSIIFAILCCMVSRRLKCWYWSFSQYKKPVFSIFILSFWCTVFVNNTHSIY